MTEQRYNVEKLKMAQQASLKILLEIDRICRAHDIKYMLDAGTLLGAVRHGGFIPWDDDVDIAMMREEFDKFRAYAEVELPSDMELVMHDTYGGGKAFYDFTPRIIFHASRRRTGNKEMDYYDGKLNHLWVDIFIQDSIPDSKLCDTFTRTLQKVIYGMSMRHRFEIDFSKYSDSDRWKVKLLSSLGSLFDMKTLFSWQEKLSRKYNITQEKTDTYYIKEIKKELNKESVNNTMAEQEPETETDSKTDSETKAEIDIETEVKTKAETKTKTKNLYYSNYQPDYIHDTVERSWSENVIDIVFEGHMLMAPSNPDGVLKVIYGDYMTLPPEEKRVPSHSDDVEVY